MRLLAFAAAGLLAVPAAADAQSAPPPHAGHWRQHVTAGHRPGFVHPRLQVGTQIHPFWFGPQFHVQDWQRYGFYAPQPDHRWVRHHDDAYLIDGEGWVHDARYGLDWDRYGERWAEEGGVPRYVGEGAFDPDARDYAWVEEHGPQPGYGYAGGPAPGDCRQPRPCGGAAHPGHGYGYGYPAYYGYGHGCGACGVVVTIVETTTTPATTRIVEETVIEEVILPRGKTVRRHPPRRRAVPPPPAPGERG